MEDRLVGLTEEIYDFILNFFSDSGFEPTPAHIKEKYPNVCEDYSISNGDFKAIYNSAYRRFKEQKRNDEKEQERINKETERLRLEKSKKLEKERQDEKEEFKELLKKKQQEQELQDKEFEREQKRYIKHEKQRERNEWINSKDEILQKVILKEYDEASELVVERFLKINSIKTIRADKMEEVWIYKSGIYIPNGETFIKEFCREIFKQSYSQYFAGLVINKLKTQTYIDAIKFFNQENFDEIAVENGILNLRTKELNPFTPEKIFLQKIPINYDSSAKCPFIHNNLLKILKYGVDDAKIVYEIFGWCLYRRYTIEKAVMGIGCGRNGKSKLWELLKIFLGEKNVSGVKLQDLDSDSFSISSLLNKLANISPDLPSIPLDYTANFKALTGQDYVSANRKFLPRLDFKNYAKLIFSCNQLPITEDDSDAFWLRWLVLEFPFSFVSQAEYERKSKEDKERFKIADTDIVSKYSNPVELSGLLNSALDGLNRLLSQGDFSNSKSSAEVRELWKRKSNSFHAFFEDCCEISDNRSDKIFKEDLHKEYLKYCSKHSIKEVSKAIIKKYLESNGVFDSKSYPEGIWEWRGIRLLPIQRSLNKKQEGEDEK